jgi:hypothetical protein
LIWQSHTQEQGQSSDAADNIMPLLLITGGGRWRVMPMTVLRSSPLRQS